MTPENEQSTPENEQSTCGWYLIYAKPHKEAIAAQQLGKQDYQVFFPQIEVKKRRRSQYINVTEPLFHRYLFIHLNQEVDNWAPIRSTIGVSHMVKFGQIPARVPNQLIELLQTQQLQVAQPTNESLFKVGDEVIVLDGPLAGYEAIFQSQKNEDRVMVLLKLANQFTKVQLELGSVGKIGA